MGKELTFKTKWDLWKAAIGRMFIYSLTPTKQTTTMETKLQIFASKCLRNIVDKEEEEGKRNNRKGKEGKTNRGKTKEDKEKKKKEKNQNKEKVTSNTEKTQTHQQLCHT